MPDCESCVRGGNVFKYLERAYSAGCLPQLESAVHGGKVFAGLTWGDEEEPYPVGGTTAMRPPSALFVEPPRHGA